MKISNIDKDFVDIIEYLDKMQFRPFASCDGVISNHSEENKPNEAYISFLESKKIIDLMATFLRDKDTFTIGLETDGYSKPHYLYGNLLEGNHYQVSFPNQKGDKTSYFEKIIKGIAEEKIIIENEEKVKLNSIDEVLKEDEESDLSFSIYLNSKYQPYTNKSGKINSLWIGTKENGEYALSMTELTNILSQRYSIPIKSDSPKEVFDEDEFMTCWFDDSICEIYFKEENLPLILEIIRYCRQIENELSKKEIKEVDFDYSDNDEEDWNL